MDAADLKQVALTTLQSLMPDASADVDHDEAHCLRGRILGVLLRQKRLAAELTLEDCAGYLSVEPHLIEGWELGASVPSLPQLESLAECFNASNPDEAGGAVEPRQPENAEYTRLRQRLVGALLQSARQAQAASIDDISARTGLEPELLRRYEYGESTMPVHHLTVLAQAVQRDLGFFTESTGSRPRRPDSSTSSAAGKNDVDADLLQFAADQKNRAVIRLAMAFRDVDHADLDRIASALLAIIRDKPDAGNRPPP